MFNPFYYNTIDKNINFTFSQRIINFEQVERILDIVRKTEFNNDNHWFIGDGCRIEFNENDSLKVHVDNYLLSSNAQLLKKELLLLL